MSTCTIFVPVLIETAAQAEALPIGTVVTGTRFGVIEKANHGRWWVGTLELPDHVTVGCQALVPVEARRVAAWDLVDEALDPAPSPDAHMWITGWEGA